MTTTATILEVGKYFGMPAAQFRKEWSTLTVEDRAQLREGIGNGTLTY